MAKKTKSIELILEDADKFFKRGNFPLAQKEFESAQIILQRDDIAEKIKICEWENKNLRIKELIKKGNKAVNKNNLSTALANFKEALTLQDEPEEWLEEKIKTFENTHFVSCADADAAKAETEGNFIEAASLYALAAEKVNNYNFLLKSASCLVKAGMYAKSLNLFSQIIEEKVSIKEYGDRFVYDYGFALAKTGSYIKAITFWNLLSDKNKSSDKKQVFLQQQKDVFALALSEIYNSVKQFPLLAEKLNLVEQVEQPNLLEQVEQLSIIASSIGTDVQQYFLNKIHLYIKYELIENAWNKGDYKTVFNLIENMEVSAEPLILSLKAKIAFHLSENDPSNLKTMVNYWLTAIYSKETLSRPYLKEMVKGEVIDISTTLISNQIQNEKIKQEKVRNKLIKMAESIISYHINTPEGASAAKQLKLETKLISDMLQIIRKSGVEESEYTKLICAPVYASLFGIADSVLNFIISKKDSFDDTEHYLETGGYYCKAWESLYLMRTGEINKAVANLDLLPKQSFNDEFSQYVRQIINFEYGKVAIERGQKDFLKYFEETHLLFKTIPSLEKRFIDFIYELHDIEPLKKYEQLISLLYDRNASDNLIKLYSFVMVHSGTSRVNMGILPERAMKHITKKALELDPNNAYAQEILNSVEIMEEVDEMMAAISKGKFAKASKIVNASHNAEVEDYYFKGIERYINQCETNYYDSPEFTLRLLQDIYESAITVNSSHLLIKRMKCLREKLIRNNKL